MRLAVAAGLLLVGTLSAQPRMRNAKVQSRSSAAGLDNTLRAIAGPAWVVYGVTATPGERNLCCWNGGSNQCCGACRLENGETTVSVSGNAGPIKLEGSREMYVFYRIENKQIEKVRAYSADCEIDAGGLPVYFLTDVKPQESVGLLASLVKDGDMKLADSAIMVIAFHADGAADRALDQFSEPSQSEEIRRKSSFWLANARGHHGYETLLRMLKNDPSPTVREHLTFCLTQSKDPGAIKTLLDTAKNDKDSRVRGQALFWLAHTAQKQLAAAAIQEAIDKDPETEVKKKAVFALTQMPAEQGVPLLIQVARTNRNREIRKQAMFWLGQSKDARALQFFEEVLAR